MFIHDALLEFIQSDVTEVPARSLYSHVQNLSRKCQAEEGGSDDMTFMQLEFKVVCNFNIIFCCVLFVTFSTHSLNSDLF